jgi:hypothetical protein
MKRPVASPVLLVVGLLFAAPLTHAQEPSQFAPPRFAVFAPLAPLVSPSLLSPGEPTGGPAELSPFLATMPLRLSLTSTIFPLADGFANCATREEASGNSTASGAPIQRFQFVRVLPHLVLDGFSSAGCPIDGGIGGGVTYSVPLKPSLWLVASAGAYGVPAHDGVIPARTAAEVRIDLMKETSDGHVFHIGLDHKNGTGVNGVPATVTFGGGF